jgi:uncharacterized surface protein with fasciclin (FAS1) repeats
MIRLFRILPIAAIVVAVPLVIAACGNDDDDTPEPTATATAPAEDDNNGAPNGEMTMDIVDTAIAAGSFQTLATALTEAGLVETLRGEGPFTVFAPTDAAFEALPDGALEGLLADTDALTAVLLYHVVAGEVMSTDLSDGMMAETAGGGSIMIHIGNGAVRINDALVVTADVEASNGVIHVIDAVLLPE